MKRILRSLAKLQVPLGIQQLDLPGLCLDGPSVEIVGFSLDCVYIQGLILKVWVKPHSDSRESAVCLSDEEVNYIHLGNRWFCVNANMNVLLLLYHQKDQARFCGPDCVLDFVWKLKVASQSVFYIRAK